MKTDKISFAIAKEPTPILNTPHFLSIFGGEDGGSLPLEGPLKLLRAMEFIALPGTKFHILSSCGNHILEVKTEEYSGSSLYVDSRFLQPVESHFPERTKILPSKNAIIQRLPQFLGLDYVWGGNWSQGIQRMKLLYPPSKPIHDREVYINWNLRGVDCSGLLYEVTDGWTPRNTSQLVHLGQGLPIQNLNKDEIAALLKPLDILVWPGHVIIVLNSHECIESLGGKGVIRSSLSDRLQELMSQRTAQNTPTQEHPFFVARRWHSECLS